MLDKTENSASYEGGGGIAVFPIPFPFLESGHIRARLRGPDGKSAALAAGKDYSVLPDGAGGGELRLLEGPLAEGTVLTISRLVPITQEIFFHNQGPNSPRAIEEAADKLTMIAQQLQEGLDSRLVAPDGSSAEELSEAIARAAGMMSGIRDQVAQLENGLQAKAEKSHGHAMAEVRDLAASLEAKAEEEAVNRELAARAPLGHNHAMNEVAGLPAMLASKVDGDDPRLERAAAHAARHALGGDDPLSPASIGSLTAPPADGKPYLAANGGWIEYVAPPGGGGEAGTSDHSQLLNRDAADQHPQSAIQHLDADLGAIRSSLEVKADKSALPSLATASRDGLLAAADKQRLDAMPDSPIPLPSGGSSGDLLSHGGSGAPAWRSPTALAADLPLMSATAKGVARLASGAGLSIGADGGLGIAPDNLLSKSAVDSAISDLGTRLTTLENRMGDLAALEGRVDALGAMAGAGDAPAGGGLYLRRNGAWVEYVEPEAGGSGAVEGEIRLLPHRAASLPAGWYFCNGDNFPLTSAAGKVLHSLPATLKSDWNITVSGDNICLPNLFAGGEGYFFRPVDNSGRLPGSVQEDAIRNITGSFQLASDAGVVWISSKAGTSILSGAFTHHDAGTVPYSFGNPITHGVNTTGPLLFDASRSVPTAGENRPRNLGMTPAIYLGV